MWTGFADRLRRAATLDAALFREVAEDEHATGPALAVVIGTACADGVGRIAAEGLVGMLEALAQGCLAWGFWLLGIHASARLLQLPSHLGPLFRGLGFAALPFALGALELLPFVGLVVSLAKWALGLAAAVTALRAVVEVETGRALLLCLGGLVVAILLSIPATWLVPG